MEWNTQAMVDTERKTFTEGGEIATVFQIYCAPDISATLIAW